MTDVVEEQTTSVETGGNELLSRTFAVADQSVDGRTLHVRVVPFDQIAEVADPPDFKPYREQFMPGVFARNEPHAHRIRLRSDHAAIDDNGRRLPGAHGIVGKGVKLTQNDGGYEAEFKFLSTPEADTALELTREGGYDGVSAEFKPIVSAWSHDGIKQRKQAHLDSVALALGPAYSKAEILALREGEIIQDEATIVPTISRELVERCEALGIELPENMSLMLARAYTEVSWDGSASRWDTPEAYCAASAIDLNPAGGAKTKDKCHLPYKEPGSGTINVNGVRAALSRIGQGYPQDASQGQRDAAKAKLQKILDSFNSSSGAN
jgi:phage head maturation protease